MTSGLTSFYSAVWLPILAAASPMQSAVRSFTDDTFAGIHQLTWFDYALMVPYFATLAVLAFFGMHRYAAIRGYLKSQRLSEREPAQRFDPLPRVTIQLPLYNEQYVVEPLLENIVTIDYPRDLLQIQVLDDSTDETHPFTQRLVAEYAAQGFPIEYHHRTNRHGYKAGALQEGLKSATGEFVAVFDADFLPNPDWLHRTIHHFTDPGVGVVQTRWTYTNRDYSLLTKVQALLLDGHFVIEHNARFQEGLFFNFNGTAGLLRKSMIDDAGGWQHDTLTEDSDLSYRAQIKGWRFVYLPAVEAPSELPVEMFSFQVQQSRWAKGLTQCALKLLPTVLRAPLGWRRKVEAIAHLAPNISYPLMVVVSALMLPVMICRFYMGWLEMLLIDLPLILSSFVSLSAFYGVTHLAVRRDKWKELFYLIPALMAGGVALTIINSRAVLEALFGVQTAFARTAKYAIGGTQKVQLKNAGYKRRSGWLPLIELALGTYFLVMCFYAVDTWNYLSIPFLAMFVLGYYWAGAATLWDEYQGLLRHQRQQALAAAQAETV
jgi:cellulose synthase/poly-beta-1,6-N-acetylglucosamine synthase-like glycosyltransferase